MACDLSYSGYGQITIEPAQNGYIVRCGGNVYVYTTLKSALKAVGEAVEEAGKL